MKKHIKMFSKSITGSNKKKYLIQSTLVALIFIAVGTYIIVNGHASTPFAAVEPESGTLTSPATVGTDASASNDSYVQFGSTAVVNPPTSSGGGGTKMIVGLNGGWGATSAADMSGSGLNVDRMDTASASGTEVPNTYYAKGVKVDVLFSGPYNTGGVIALAGCASTGQNCTLATSWADNQLSWYETNCPSAAAECPSIEVLNEPSGSWFWGTSASSNQNAVAYGNLLKTTYNVFHAKYGANSPLVLGNTYEDANDCGPGSVAPCTNSWEESMSSGVADLSSYYDGVISHPYGGSGDSTTVSAEGNRSDVESAHDVTGKPVYVTEIGWPTATSQAATGDSYQWTQQEQADNIYNFMTWSRSTGYVNEVDYFNYRDYGTNDWYGVECSIYAGSSSPGSCSSASADGAKKIGWYALTCAAEQKAENCAD